MTDYEKVARFRQDLEAMRNDLSQRIETEKAGKADLIILHDRVSRAIKALSPHR